MAELRPFRGVRPPKEGAQEIAAPPYDVVSSAEARAYARGRPRCFFRISRPEVDLPEGVDEHADAVYAKGLENLAHFRQQGWLVPEAAPRLYLYRQRMGRHVQTGLVAAASVDEYDRGLIKKHELTRADKEDDRTRHVDTLGGNDEPVFLTYRAQGAIDALVEEGTRAAPEYDFVTDDGIGHTFWVVPEALGARLQEAFRRVGPLYIADGHHRSAAASRVHALRRARGARDGSGAFLAVVFPDAQMQILPYNRAVKDLQGLSPEALLARLGERFEVAAADGAKAPDAVHRFGMYLGGRWYRLVARPGSWERTPVGELDVTLLQRNALEPLLGIGDPRKDERIHFVGGIRGTGELERLVDGGGWAVAFSLYPTRVEQLMAIADAGDIMPPKSTWFEPKLRSGLVLHQF